MHQFSGARSAPYKIAGIYCFGCWQRVVRNVDGLDGRHQAPMDGFTAFPNKPRPIPRRYPNDSRRNNN